MKLSFFRTTENIFLPEFMIRLTFWTNCRIQTNNTEMSQFFMWYLHLLLSLCTIFQRYYVSIIYSIHLFMLPHKWERNVQQLTCNKFVKKKCFKNRTFWSRAIHAENPLLLFSISGWISAKLLVNYSTLFCIYFWIWLQIVASSI